MSHPIGLSRAAIAFLTLVTVASAALSAGPAEAVVYCKTIGVPKGCVARPVSQAPVSRHVVYCKTRGVPKGCVMR